MNYLNEKRNSNKNKLKVELQHWLDTIFNKQQKQKMERKSLKIWSGGQVH